jgi:non-specific serine/threonine protein kinase
MSLAASVTYALATAEPGSAAPSQWSTLSARERDVVALIGRGLTNREIAAALVLAERTVEAHVTHVLNKLGLRSRAQIAVWATQQAWRAQSSPHKC